MGIHIIMNLFVFIVTFILQIKPKMSIMDGNVCENSVMVMVIDTADAACCPLDTCILYFVAKPRPRLQSAQPDWPARADCCQMWTNDLSPHFTPPSPAVLSYKRRGPSAGFIVARTTAGVQ